MYYVLSVPAASHYTYETLRNDIPKSVPDLSYLKGFIAGYGFGKIQLLTVPEYEAKRADCLIENSHVLFVDVGEPTPKTENDDE